MRLLALIVVALGTALPSYAQNDGGATSVGRYIQPGGALNLASAPAGPLDLNGFHVTTDAEGRLYAAARGGTPGFYTDISSGPDGPSFSGNVTALAVGPDGSVYVGGRFTTAGAVAANGIARWDGAEWHPLGEGLNGGPVGIPLVYSITVDSNGDIYAGGSFTMAGGQPANHIARWDGSTWVPLGPGLGTGSSSIRAIAITPDGTLYAGGDFSLSGSPARGIARWNGTAWSALGTGLNGSFVSVYDLAVGPDSGLYVGGKFNTAGGETARNVARWDGSLWSAVGTLGPSVSGVSEVEFSPSGVLFAALNYSAGGTYNAAVVRWDGTNWNDYGAPFQGSTVYSTSVSSLAFAPNGSVYAGGHLANPGTSTVLGLARWNGTAWQSVGGGVNGSVNDLLSTSEGLYAGGEFTTAGGLPATRLARWDETSWHGFGSSINNTVLALAADESGHLYAAGYFTSVGNVTTRAVARWNGTSWTTLGSGTEGTVSALTVGLDGSLYAGGAFTSIGGVAAKNVARWDGSQWHPLGSGITAYGSTSVVALAVGLDGSLYAAGSISGAGDTPTEGVAKWDGTSWSALGSGLSDNGASNARSLAVGPDGSLYVGGAFNRAGGTGSQSVAANGIARWDGTTWHALGTGVGGVTNAAVLAMAFDVDGNLYAGGDFTTAGDAPAAHVARWNGSVWSTLGTGTSGGSGNVNAIISGPNGLIYVGGDFTDAGGTAVGGMVGWDGSMWTALDGGVNGIVQAFALGASSDVFVGGTFGRAGSVVSPYLVRYTPPTVAAEPTLPLSLVLDLRLAPNPSRGVTTAQISHPAGPVALDVFDALGRRVLRVVTDDSPAGQRAVPLDLSGLAPGVYAVRLTAGRESQTRQLVIVQ